MSAKRSYLLAGVILALALLVSFMSQVSIASANSAPAEKVPFTLGTTTTDEVVRVQRLAATGGQVLNELFYGHVTGAYKVSHRAPGVPSSVSYHNGGTDKWCVPTYGLETTTGGVSVMQRTCGASLGTYPHLVANNFWIGQPLEPTWYDYGRTDITPFKEWSVQVTDQPLKTFLNIQTNVWLLQVNLNRWIDGSQPEDHYWAYLAFDNNQALEATVHFRDGNRTEVKTFWFQNHEWHVMDGPAHIGPDSPFTSLAEVNKLTVFADGTVRYDEAPHNCVVNGRTTC